MMNTTRAILDDLKATEEARKENDRTTPSDRFPGLTIAEAGFYLHMQRWGSAGYPVAKMGGKWFWNEAFAVSGTPSPFKTKKAAHEAIETYLGILRDKIAGRL